MAGGRSPSSTGARRRTSRAARGTADCPAASRDALAGCVGAAQSGRGAPGSRCAESGPSVEVNVPARRRGPGDWSSAGPRQADQEPRGHLGRSRPPILQEVEQPGLGPLDVVDHDRHGASRASAPRNRRTAHGASSPAGPGPGPPARRPARRSRRATSRAARHLAEAAAGARLRGRCPAVGDTSCPRRREGSGR